MAREANKSTAPDERTHLAAVLRASAEFLGLLGGDPEHWFTQAGAELNDSALDSDAIEQLIEQRTAARASKDFVAADQIRDQLAAAGIQIEDGAGGTRWRRGE